MIPPTSWPKDGDGVQFHIGLRHEDGTEWVWKHWLDPKNNPKDQDPVPFNIQIPKQTQAIHLKVGPGNKSDYRHDSVLWLSLDLKETTEH